jgi:hypothetical protein
MNPKTYSISLFVLFLLSCSYLQAVNYPDQHYVLKTDSIYANIETNTGIKLSVDGKSLELENNVNEAYIILKPQSSESPFNQGLPSWNGLASSNLSSFKVQMRFPYGSGWSPWLTVGYWKANIWGSYGSTSFAEGYVDIDYVKLNVYKSSWQFKVILTRVAGQPSPKINKLSFFVSDSRTTSSLNLTDIVNDNPAAIFIPTSFIYQYGVDPQIGPSICSPTTVSMILRSYNITVDPLPFAQATYDPYHQIFGVWPRVVQNASEFGTDGAVTRYRTWSQARQVLENGGRIGMSVGLPLYSGHLIMLAGFNANGSPIVHDPAKQNGYSYVFDKTDLSRSWFQKGGISYTFYPSDVTTSTDENQIYPVNDFVLYQNYPNPFNPQTTISYDIKDPAFVSLKIYNVLGKEVAELVNESKAAGSYSVVFNAGHLPSGIYFSVIKAGSFSQTQKMTLIK